MSQFVSNFTKTVVGLGQTVEDGKPVPVIFKPAVPAPLINGEPQKLSPYPAQNPLPK